MKIKEGFMLREVAGNYIVVPVGSASKKFNGMITLNETSAFLWNILLQDSSCEQLVDALMQEYEVSNDVATKDVEAFVNKLQEIKVLEL